jgi:hypothetical protein
MLCTINPGTELGGSRIRRKEEGLIMNRIYKPTETNKDKRDGGREGT